MSTAQVNDPIVEYGEKALESAVVVCRRRNAEVPQQSGLGWRLIRYMLQESAQLFNELFRFKAQLLEAGVGLMRTGGSRELSELGLSRFGEVELRKSWQLSLTKAR